MRIGHYNFKVWNFGRDGFTTSQVRFLARLVLQQHSHLAFVMAGTNDANQEKGEEAAQESALYYYEILETLRSANVEAVITSTLYRQDDPHPEFVTELNRLLLEYAEKNQIAVIDLNRIVAAHQSLLPQYSLDGVHLTEAAYEVWAEEVKRVLKNRNMRSNAG